MTIVVPGMDLDGERVECQPTHGEISYFLTKSRKQSFRKRDTISQARLKKQREYYNSAQ